jgi:hypothetical protein
MAGGWSRWVLLWGKFAFVFGLPLIHQALHLKNPNSIEILTVCLLISGINCIGRSSWYRKQRSLCWDTCFFTISNIQDKRCSGWQHRAVCATNWSLAVYNNLSSTHWCVIVVYRCVICRVEFEEGESLVALPCKHSYHPECINQWLQINKVC